MLKCSHGVGYEARCPQCLQEGLTRVVEQQSEGKELARHMGETARPGSELWLNNECVRLTGELQEATMFKSHILEVVEVNTGFKSVGGLVVAYTKLKEENEALKQSRSEYMDICEQLSASNEALRKEEEILRHVIVQQDRQIEELAQIASQLKKESAASAVPDGWTLVPMEPTEKQWGGLARDIMMAFDMNAKTPRKLFEHLDNLGREIPDWLRNEPEMKNLDHVPSKGTRAVIIYRAFLEAAPIEAKSEPSKDEVDGE